MTLGRAYLRVILFAFTLILIAFVLWGRMRPSLSGIYSGSHSCQSCHATIYEEWQSSHHAQAQKEASHATSQGEFSGKSISADQHAFTLRSSGDNFYMDVRYPTGQTRTYQLRGVIGVRPLVQYLVPFPGGRYQPTPVAYDTERKEWFHLYPDEPRMPQDWGYWANRGMTWNTMCAMCHTTDFRKNYDQASDSFKSRWLEIGVGCEACHGPAAAHAEWQKRSWIMKLLTSDPIQPNLDQLPQIKRLEVCAACHTRQRILQEGFHLRKNYYDHFEPLLLDSDTYYADGQIRDEAFEMVSFWQSKMYSKGVRCEDCHNPHSGKLVKTGNALCLQCHETRFDSRSHHFHSTGKPGANCVDCHMPTTTFMVRHARRDHSFSLPTPELTLRLGIPNACNRCHADRSAEWALEKVLSWYGPGERQKIIERAEIIHRARQGIAGAWQGLIQILEDKEASSILRASSASLLAAYGSEGRVREALRRALSSPDPLIRMMAVRAWGKFGSERDIPEEIYSALRDPYRIVREEAVVNLARWASNALPAAYKESFSKAAQEHISTLQTHLDTPEAAYNLGLFLDRLGRQPESEAAYRHSLNLLPEGIPSRHNLAMLLYRTGRADEAEKQLRELTRYAPELAEGHFFLALLLAEKERWREAIAELEKTLELNSDYPRGHYNLGLAYSKIGELAKAEFHLREAVRSTPDSDEAHYALATVLLLRGKRAEGIEEARKALAINPNHREARRLLAVEER